ncbi:MAG: tetratricopeptide repeat protein [Polyangiaceae bacterium]|nr:tetratricopeptide repeat protein [Polyangiaceae bacterium]
MTRPPKVSLLAVALLAVACGGGAAKVERAPVLPPANPKALGKMAQAVQSAGERQRAIALLREAVKIDPNLWEARYNLGVLLAQVGDLADAEQELSKAQSLAPNAEDVVVALGEVRRRLEDPKGAVAVLEPFVKSNPKAVAARIELVSALREAGEVELAIRHAREVLVRRSNDPNALAELAMSHLERGEVDAAELLVKEAEKAAPDNAVVVRTSGLVSLKRGDDAVAFKRFAKASELDPKDTTARLNTGTVLLQAGIYEKAVGEFRGVLAVNPDDIMASIGLAAALRGTGGRDKQGPYLEAEKILKQVLEREPKNLSALFNLGVLYADYLKRPSDAKPHLTKFVDLSPKAHPAREMAQKILSGTK